jgi:8-oxo-dGTP pyrophosphatase MutT (NUDIX family)
MTDPLFAAVYNEALLEDLTKQFGPIHRHHVSLSVSTPAMLDLMGKMKNKPRRGEVVMVIPNEQGQIWLHTKAFYPNGIYRLMTGGLESGELPDQAMQREAEEETGFKTKIDRCLAAIIYKFKAQEEPSLFFVSYVFLTFPINGLPHPTDPDEAITNFRAVPVEDLAAVTQKLRSLKGDFADWGTFRAIAHQLTWEKLTTGEP